MSGPPPPEARAAAPPAAAPSRRARRRGRSSEVAVVRVEAGRRRGPRCARSPRLRRSGASNVAEGPAEHRQQVRKRLGRERGEPAVEDAEEGVVVIEDLAAASEEPLDPGGRAGRFGGRRDRQVHEPARPRSASRSLSVEQDPRSSGRRPVRGACRNRPAARAPRARSPGSGVVHQADRRVGAEDRVEHRRGRRVVERGAGQRQADADPRDHARRGVGDHRGVGLADVAVARSGSPAAAGRPSTASRRRRRPPATRPGP